MPTATDTPMPTATDTPNPTATNTPNPTATEMPSNSCSYTIGYWKNHLESWPVSELTLGDISYSQSDLLDILNTPPRGDATYILGHQLIGAKLNIANGADNSAVADTIIDADNWLIDNPLGSNPKKYERAKGISYANTLDNYNNGVIGPGHCDDKARTQVRAITAMQAVDMTDGISQMYDESATNDEELPTNITLADMNAEPTNSGKTLRFLALGLIMLAGAWIARRQR
jgi:hypothetical protein